MKIGVLKEIKTEENRVAITPAGAEVISQHGHQVLLESGAGKASGFDDDQYADSGAKIMDDPGAIFKKSEMILRVKEPQPSEYAMLQNNHIYFSYLHLAASKDVTKVMCDSGVTGIAYETVQKDDGSLPLLTPMSQVAGPMAIQEGAKYLEMAQGGHGVLLGGVPGVDPGTVVIIGGGKVGINAARIASGLGAKVYVLDVDLDRLRYLSDVMPSNCFVLMSSPAAIRDLLPKADLVVGSVLVPGSRTPIMITREMLKHMKKGAVLVDVAIDQGGCFETSRETTHSDPIYVVDDIVHYAVSNMPGALPQTSTIALTNATLPCVLEIAGKGWKAAALTSSDIKRGVNIVAGRVTYKSVAEANGVDHTPVESFL